MIWIVYYAIMKRCKDKETKSDRILLQYTLLVSPHHKCGNDDQSFSPVIPLVFSGVPNPLTFCLNWLYSYTI